MPVTTLERSCSSSFAGFSDTSTRTVVFATGRPRPRSGHAGRVFHSQNARACRNRPPRSTKCATLPGDTARQSPQQRLENRAMQTFSARVSRVRSLTHDVREIELTLLEPSEIRFAAGQFVSCEIERPGFPVPAKMGRA